MPLQRVVSTHTEHLVAGPALIGDQVGAGVSDKVIRAAAPVDVLDGRQMVGPEAWAATDAGRQIDIHRALRVSRLIVVVHEILARTADHGVAAWPRLDPIVVGAAQEAVGPDTPRS